MENRFINTIKHAALWLFYFFRYSVRQFYQQRGLQIASSLAYTTLLSLVPLIAVAFVFMENLPMFQEVGESIQVFIFENFIPSFGNTIWQYLEQFSRKASQLTITGIAVLIIIAMMLMSTIDGALNTIWHVRDRRSAVARFPVYWAVITLGPLLVGVGIFSTSYLLSTSIFTEVDASYGLDLKHRLLSWLPFITTSTAFTLIYILVPNCFVSRRHAIIGGMFAAIAFELAKYGFGIYVKNMTAYETLYGAVAIIPVFLIWIYLSWVVVILGAHVSFCLSSFRFEREQAGISDPDWTFIDAYRLIAALRLAQKEGSSLHVAKLARYGIRIPQHHMSDIMGLLEEKNWVQKDAGGGWLLSRNLAEVTVLDLSRLIPKRLPFGVLATKKDKWSEQLENLLEEHQASLQEDLGAPIEELLRAAEEKQDNSASGTTQSTP